jgi:hypothetical protein
MYKQVSRFMQARGRALRQSTPSPPDRKERRKMRKLPPSALDQSAPGAHARGAAKAAAGGWKIVKVLHAGSSRARRRGKKEKKK